ncbi:MAG: hypothetical protein IJU81_04400 [Bacteroidales bacterium]|nr:hypothetical protein [Bacteroidales bacterium]
MNTEPLPTPNAELRILDEFTLEEMGVSAPALQEIERILGRRPTTDELSTLLAMWQGNANGCSLYTWLKGQPRADNSNAKDYLYTGCDNLHQSINEPRVKECIDIARQLCRDNSNTAANSSGTCDKGELLYLAGDITTGFLDSEYAQKYLHIASSKRTAKSPREETQYLKLILGALYDKKIINGLWQVGAGGIFKTLATVCSASRLGFDILTCREVRMDAFLFGEDGVRFIVSVDEKNDDEYLRMMNDARVNCCFLGRATKGRVLVDGMDFGDIGEYTP